MNKKGTTLIDVLAIITAIIVVSAVMMLLFFFAGRESRDVKRVSDVGVLRSTLATLKVQSGSFLASGCEPGLVYSCQGGGLEELLPTIPNFRDPSGVVSCLDNCDTVCEYAFHSITEDNYEVYFHLERGVGNWKESGCYVLSPSGIVKK